MKNQSTHTEGKTSGVLASIITIFNSIRIYLQRMRLYMGETCCCCCC